MSDELELVWTLIPKGRENGTYRVTAALSPRAVTKSATELKTVLARWRDFIKGGAAPAAITLHAADGTTKDVTASFAPRQPFNADLWNTFLADAPLDSCFADRAKPAQRVVRTNYAAKVSEFQRERHAEHFAAMAQRWVPDAPPMASASAQSAATADLRFFRRPEEFSAPAATPEEASAQSAEGELQLHASASSVDDIAQRAHSVVLRASGGAQYTFLSRVGEVARSLANKEAQRAQTSVFPMASAAGQTPDNIAAALSVANDVTAEEAVLGMLAFHGRVPNLKTPTAQTAMSSAANPPCTFDFHERVALLNGYPALLRPAGLVLDFTIAALPFMPVAISISPSPFAQPVAGIAHLGPQTLLSPDDFRPLVATSTLTKAAALPLATNRFVAEMTDLDGSALKYVNHVNQPAATEDAQSAATPPSRRSAGISILDKVRSDELRKRLDLSRQQPADARLAAEDLNRGLIIEVRRKGDRAWTELTRRNEKYQFGAKDHPIHDLNPGEQQNLVRLTAVRATDRVASATPGVDDLHVPESLFRWDGWSLAVAPVLQDPVPDETAAPPTDNKQPDWELKPTYEVPCGSLIPLRFGQSYEFRARAADLVGEALGAPDDTNAISHAVTYRRYDPVPPPIVLLDQPLDLKERPSETLYQMVLPKPTRGLRTEGVVRCLAPPMATFGMAEQHGVYDGRPESETPLTIGGYTEVLLGRGTNGCWGLPTTADCGLNDPGDCQSLPIARRPASPDTRQFLPDPLAKHLCVRIEDLVSGATIELPPHPFYDRPWPHAKLLRIRLQVRDDGKARIGAKWLRGPETLAVALPPGWKARVKISCGVEHGDLPLLGVVGDWRGAIAQGAADAVAKVEERVCCGCHEMVSPNHDLTLIHPVAKPLVDPVIERMLVTRASGETRATFDARLLVDRKSTGRMLIEAEWKDCHDDPKRPEPEETHNETKIAKLQRSPVTGKEESLPEVAVASPEDARDFSPQAQSALEETLVHPLVDTRAYVVRYSARAVTRFEHDIPEPKHESPDQTLDDLSICSKPFEVRIPSSARPDPPVIRYVVPTFRWEQSEDRFEIDPHHRFESSRRTGVRVVLERPWCSSGGGEMLAVVLWPGISPGQIDALNSGGTASMLPPREIPESMQMKVTRWGMDPIWNAAPTSLAPTANHFPGARFATNLRLPDTAGDDTLVTVAAYEPRFDKRRNAWYADIDVHPIPSYWPFLRLALARYQPLSLPGLELSPVRLADFVQLVPDRTATVMRMPEEKNALFVEVFGKDGGKGCNLAPNSVHVSVERRCRSAAGDFVWVPDGAFRIEEAAGSREALWSGIVRVEPAGARRRILIRECEHLPTDGPGWDATKTSQKSRLIYADVLEV